MKKILISPLLLTLFLQACGGSSSSTPDVPVVPIEYTFSLTSQITNDCGVSIAFTDVELLLQDGNWQTIGRHVPDESGVISFKTESEFINYTIVAKDQEGSEAEGLNVVSFYQASSTTPSYYQAQFDERLDNTSCECITQDLKLSHRPYTSITSVTSSLNFNSWSQLDGSTTLFEGVPVCRAIDGDWPLHSFSVLGTDSNQKVISSAEFIDDFSANVEGVWSLAAFQVSDSIELATPHQAFNTNQLIQNNKHFSMLVSKDEESLLIFDTHNYISEAKYQSQAQVTFDESSSIFGSSVIRTHQQIISTSASTSFAVKASEQKPAIDDRNFSEIKADGNYDYSAVTDHPMAMIVFTFTTYHPTTKLLMPAKWTFYGPEKGMLAISAPLTGYEDIININTDKNATDVRLIQSMMTNNYQDYVKHYQGIKSTDMSSDFVNKLNEVEISIKLN